LQPLFNQNYFSMEQVFFNVPLSKLEPIFKRWIKEAQTELQPTKVEPTEKPEQLLTVQEAAALLHLTVPTLYSKHSKGELPGVCKRGKRLYFSKQSLIEWVKEGRKKSNAEIEQEAEAYLSNNRKGLK
jgi:excisionase family DNA binding protein